MAQAEGNGQRRRRNAPAGPATAGAAAPWQEQLARAVQDGDAAAAARLAGELHPADLAEFVLSQEPALRARLLGWLRPEQAALVVEELPAPVQSEILAVLDRQRAGAVLEEMSSDEVADLLGELPPQRAVDLLRLLRDREAADVRSLLAYLDDTAGGLMTTEFVALQDDLTAAEAIDALRRLAPDAETIYYVYVVDREERLQGVLSLRELIVAPPDTPIRRIMRTRVVTVPPDMDQEEVARVVAKYDLLAVPVVDAEGRILGIVTVDDVVDVLEEEASEDIYRLTATPEGAAAGTSWLRARLRLPWLVGLLLGELVVAKVIQGFEGTLERVAELAYFIPLLAATAGNVGTQSLATAVRGLATGEIARGEALRVLGRELQVGLLLALVLALTSTGLVYAVLGNGAVAVTVGTAMGLNTLVAAAIGVVVPLALHGLRVDPAVASGPFVTTTLDVVGTLVYFLTATWLLFRVAG
ncbi:magnesium transporter [Thermaerobacter sp. PB12/4term]|uniref:magnesium transporter n=1 Tax=Thermaerobacter sp. PB12/4term TaxID=2293838 RepID=UPI000E32C52C|nr:magnesium transporter [Thermaerobacter sp. PB12/4term]QIA27930.1 magnesium transporter [Thermaerobacter sp. PB12/4term]